jgi:hypothetical protein
MVSVPMRINSYDSIFRVSGGRVLNWNRDQRSAELMLLFSQYFVLS